jgi:hypothetical protein
MRERDRRLLSNFIYSGVMFFFVRALACFVFLCVCVCVYMCVHHSLTHHLCRTYADTFQKQLHQFHSAAEIMNKGDFQTAEGLLSVEVGKTSESLFTCTTLLGSHTHEHAH